MNWRTLLVRTGTTVLLLGLLLILLLWRTSEAALAASLPENLDPAEAECASANVPLPADTLERTELYGARPSDGSAGAAARAGPGFDVYLEGVLVEGVLAGCLLLETAPGETWLLLGDRQGFGDGDYVGVWANFCPSCVSVCMQGTMGYLEVKDIVGLDPPPTPPPTATPQPVGGIADLPDVVGTPLQGGGSSGPGIGVLAGVVAAIAAGAVALGGVAWYARRR